MFFATFYIIANISMAIQFYTKKKYFSSITNYGCCTDAFLGKASVGQALNF